MLEYSSTLLSHQKCLCSNTGHLTQVTTVDDVLISTCWVTNIYPFTVEYIPIYPILYIPIYCGSAHLSLMCYLDITPVAGWHSPPICLSLFEVQVELLWYWQMAHSVKPIASVPQNIASLWHNIASIIMWHYGQFSEEICKKKNLYHPLKMI